MQIKEYSIGSAPPVITHARVDRAPGNGDGTVDISLKMIYSGEVHASARFSGCLRSRVADELHDPRGYEVWHSWRSAILRQCVHW
jgi:hypothetical protein